MVLFRSIPKELRVILIVLTLVAVVYGSAWAFNIASKSSIPGKGLYYGSGPVVDTLLIRTGWLNAFYGDTCSPDTTHLKTALGNSFVTLVTVQDISGVKHFTDTLEAGTQATDGVFKIYSEQGATDYGIVFKPHTTMTQTTVYVWPANDGDASQYLQTDGSGNLVWATPTGAGNMSTSTYDVAVNGIVDDVDTVGTLINAALAKRATKVMLQDSIYIRGGKMLQDSIYIRAGKMFTDSAWTNSALPPIKELSLSQGFDDSTLVIWPISVINVSGWIVKHMNISGLNDQMDTIVFSRDIPIEVIDVDSITFNLRTSSADTAVSGLRIRCFKQTAELGAWTALTATLIGYFTATDAWEHKSIPGASIGAIAGGNRLEIEICGQLDINAIIYHTEPKVYCWHHK